MARIRTVKPEFWTSEQVVDCSPIARLLFIGMWNFCDDAGNHPASVKTLKMEVFPGDDITTAEVQCMVDEIINAGLIVEYAAEGRQYWHVSGWHHQKIEKPSYKHPSYTHENRLPVADQSPSDTGYVADHSTPEWNGKEGSNKTLLSESGDSNSLPAETKTDNVVKIDSAKPQIPYQQIIDAYHEALPELPAVRLQTEARRKAIKSRWIQMLNSDRGDGTLRYTDAESGIRWWTQYFNHVRHNSHWLGDNDRGWTADFDWLLNLNNFTKVLEYRPRASA